MNSIVKTATLLTAAALACPIPAAIEPEFDGTSGEIKVRGDAEDDLIVISRTKSGQILINNGQVPIRGGTPTVFNTVKIIIEAGDGNDEVRIDTSNGALPDCFIDGEDGDDRLFGGDGVDVLRGGAGNDVLIGGRGNDVVLGQDGSDLLIVNDGDGSDFFEGGEGFDFVQVNGSNTAGDDFSIDPNDERVRFQRNNLGLFTLDIGTTENLDVHGQGGSDVIIGSTGLVGLIGLDLDGGEGNDLLIGGDGVDVLRGGAGNDVLLGGQGNDFVFGENGNDLIVINEGDGNDLIEGGLGRDTVQVEGSARGDDFLIQPGSSPGRVRFQRNNLGLFTLDIGTTENLDVNGQGGSDVIIGSTGLVGMIELDLDGGEGNDLLIGGDGADVLRGGSGNDVLLGDRGNDFADGGRGIDTALDCERIRNVEFSRSTSSTHAPGTAN